MHRASYGADDINEAVDQSVIGLIITESSSLMRL